MRQLFVAVFVLLLTPGLAPARPLTDAETASLTATVEAFDAAMRGGEFETIVKTIPPRVLEHIAKTAGVDVETLRKVVIEQMKAALAAVKLESFGMDVANAEHKELPNGDPFVLIPTETVMDAGDAGKIKATGHTLGLLDGGVWYLVRVSDAQQVTILRQVYPEFAGIELPAGSTEAVE